MSDKFIRTIHSRKMAIFLQLRGFILIGINNDLKSNRKVFLFSDSPELQSTMAEFSTDNSFHRIFQNMSVGR